MLLVAIICCFQTIVNTCYKQYCITMSEIVEILGNNIRFLRKQKEWTQEILAEKAGISVPFMTQIELARKTPSLDVIENIALALDVPYDRLFKTSLTGTSDKETLHEFKKSLQNAVLETIKEQFQFLS